MGSRGKYLSSPREIWIYMLNFLVHIICTLCVGDVALGKYLKKTHNLPGKTLRITELVDSCPKNLDCLDK